MVRYDIFWWEMFEWNKDILKERCQHEEFSSNYLIIACVFLLLCRFTAYRELSHQGPHVYQLIIVRSLSFQRLNSIESSSQRLNSVFINKSKVEISQMIYLKCSRVQLMQAYNPFSPTLLFLRPNLRNFKISGKRSDMNTLLQDGVIII